VLSLGQRQLQIPLLEGNSLRASRIELLRAGLQVGEVSGVTMTEQPVDAVVVQNPKPGAGRQRLAWTCWFRKVRVRQPT